MANYGFKVSKTGYDVRTTEDKNLVFSSAFNTLKVYKKGNLSITTDGSGNATTDVTHGLGFAPAFKVFVKDGSDYYPDPSTVNRNFGNSFFKLHAYTDSTKLYFQASGATASTTYHLKYYIFADLAQSFSGTSVSLSNDYGIKVAKPGVNVADAEVYELLYSSSFPVLKFDDLKVGSFTMNLAAINCTDSPNTQSTSTSIAHGLGYPPMFLCAFRTDNSTIYPSSASDRQTLPWSVHSPTTDAGIWVLEARCDDTNVIFDWYRMASCITAITPCDLECISWGAEEIIVYYYIFREDVSQL